MTTVQYQARIKKYFRLYGVQDLTGIEIPIYHPENNGIVQVERSIAKADRLVNDDGEIGVLLNNGTWFIPVDELVYKELKMIMKRIEANIKK